MSIYDKTPTFYEFTIIDPTGKFSGFNAVVRKYYVHKDNVEQVKAFKKLAKKSPNSFEFFDKLIPSVIGQLAETIMDNDWIIPDDFNIKMLEHKTDNEIIDLLITETKKVKESNKFKNKVKINYG